MAWFQSKAIIKMGSDRPLKEEILMRIENLKNCNLNGVVEIKCSESFYSKLNGYPNAVVKGNNGNYNLYYKGAPVFIDKSIRILEECNLVYENNIQVNFYDGIVKNLKKEAVKLNDKLAKIRESLSSINSSQSSQSRSNDMNLYISTLKSLRDTLDLISKYDWRLMYSEYETDSGCAIKKPLVKQVSVWEQNHDNQIRNHKVWNVVEALDVAIKQTKDEGRKISEALKSVSEDINVKEMPKKTYSVEITDYSVETANLLTEKYPEMFQCMKGVYIGTGEPVKTINITI